MNSIGQYPAIIKNITDLKIAGDPNIANRLDDEGVKNILTLPELNFLTLENVTISDEASVHFASSNITSLNFIPQNITSRTLISALSCSHLRHLTIKNFIHSSALGANIRSYCNVAQPYSSQFGNESASA